MDGPTFPGCDLMDDRRPASSEGRWHITIAVIGLDLAKNVFQIHGIDASGRAVLKRKLRRSEVLPLLASLPPALVGIEACHGDRTRSGRCG